MVSDYGLKFSIKGKSVIGNTNLQELGFTSNFPSLKTSSQGVKSVSVGASSSVDANVFHSLIYRPAFNAYFRDTGTGEIFQVMSGFDDIGFERTTPNVNVLAKSDNQSLNFRIQNGTGITVGVDIFYEIFIEDLSGDLKVFYF